MQNTGQKEIGVKTGGKEKTRITAELAVCADGSKLPPCLIFKGKPTPSGKSPAPNSIEREFKNGKDKKGITYPRGVVYAVDDKVWHTQRVFQDVWLPQVWSRRPGREGRVGNYRQPDTLLAWDDYTVHKTEMCKEAMKESNTTLFLVHGGLTPKIQPCDGRINKLFKSNLSGLYDDHMATNPTRSANGYPEPPSRGLLAQWVKRAWDAVDADSIRSSWKKAGLLLTFDGSEDEEWARKELDCNPDGAPVDGAAGAAGDAASSTGKILEVLEIIDDDSTEAGDDAGEDSDVVELPEKDVVDVVDVADD